MEWSLETLQTIGDTALQLYWVPVLIWTLVAAAAAMLLKILENRIAAVYQYHIRVALLLGLAAGVAGSAVLYFLPFGSAPGGAMTARFIVIRNPITVAAPDPAGALSWSDPVIWAGLATALIMLGALVALLKLARDFWSLRLFAHSLGAGDRAPERRLTRHTRRQLMRCRGSVHIIFSGNVEVPCTFGWLNKRIVLPARLRDHREKLNMAVRHELSHIRNSDFLINTAIKVIKALFFFHPLVHRLGTRIEEYREIYCDQHVLQDADISPKHYARMLLELSPKSVYRMPAAVNMAVQPSTLRKRIETMKTSTPTIPSFRWSITLMLVSALMITGLMACSDIEDGGITSSEVEEAQANMNRPNAPVKGNQPLYIVNDEVMQWDKQHSILSRLKPKYIESINVLKGKKAVDRYGQKGENGVIELTLFDKEKAFSDLRASTPPPPPAPAGSPDPEQEFYVKVEKAPEIIGGQQALFNNLDYPASCRNAGIEGKVIVRFIVTKEGDVDQAEVMKGIGSGCDQAALEAVRQLQFRPGTQDGKAVNVQFSLPILFRMSNSDATKKQADTAQSTAMLNDENSRMMDEVLVTGYGSASGKRSPLEVPMLSSSFNN